MIKISAYEHLNVKENPVENAKAVVVINHGFAEHMGRYDWVCDTLNASGYSVVRYEVRNHGQTSALLESYRDFINDFDLLIDRVASTYPGLDIFTLGHSMGGMITGMYGLVHAEKLKGQILSGAALHYVPAIKGIKKPVLDFVATVFPNMMIKNIVDEGLCSVSEVVDKYKRDPLVLRKAPAVFYREFTIQAPKFIEEHVEDYTLPVLLLHGEKDTIVPPSISEWFYDKIQSSDKTRITYPNLQHEILNEYAKEEVMGDIINWLDKHKSN